MSRFVVTTEGNNKLNLRQVCQDFINDAWVPTHLTPEEAVHFVLDHFKRTVLSELKLLDVAVVEEATAHD